MWLPAVRPAMGKDAWPAVSKAILARMEPSRIRVVVPEGEGVPPGSPGVTTTLKAKPWPAIVGLMDDEMAAFTLAGLICWSSLAEEPPTN